MLSGWCGQRGIPACAQCVSTGCGCACHDENMQVSGPFRTPVRVESGEESGPESTDIDRGLPITQLKDVTG